MKKIFSTFLAIGFFVSTHAQFSIQPNGTDPSSIDILYTAPAAYQGDHAVQFFEFALQVANPDGSLMSAVFTPTAPLASLTGFNYDAGTDYGNTTFTWTSTGIPNYGNTYNFTSTEVVLGTVTFSSPSSMSGVTFSAIDYQAQPFYGGTTGAAVWTMQLDATGTDVTDYNNLFYQSSASNAPYTTNDGGVINQKLDIILAPLPIALSDFTAKLNNRHTVDLNWVTQTENNNKGFDIERSSNGRDFKKIAYVASKATDAGSTAKLAYASEDPNPVIGDNYYRLKELSVDGKATYSVVRKVTIGRGQLISLYPNPANSFVNIKGLQADDVIRVYDIAGKVILEKKAAESQLMQIDVSGIANGNYQVAVFSNYQRVFVGKLVKND